MRLVWFRNDLRLADNPALAAACAAPPVTAVRQPVAAFGRRALTLLAETDWQEAESFVEELLPVDFAVRGSVAPPATA